MNHWLGDIVKVTPTSKVVGDMALMRVASDLTPADRIQTPKHSTEHLLDVPWVLDHHGARHSLPGMLQLLDGLAPQQRSTIVRGDCAFGADPTMGALEERG